jgi:hypothetical protein
MGKLSVMMMKSWMWGGDNQRAVAPPQRKAGIDAVNGSPCLSPTSCRAAACDVLAKITSVRAEIFRLTSETPYKVWANLM